MSSVSDESTAPPKWLSWYATPYLDWRQSKQNGNNVYYRPLGIVEHFFDTDGTDFGGRADVAASLCVETRNCLSKQQLQDRIVLAWAVLRSQHVLLSARAGAAHNTNPGQHTVRGMENRCFIYEQDEDPSRTLRRASEYTTFVEDYYSHVDPEQFWDHLLNCSRTIDATKNLSRLFVLPVEDPNDGTLDLKFIFILAHQIADGLTIFRWMSHFIDLINTPTETLQKQLTSLCLSDATQRLPAAQESLYPPPKGSLARQRWHWLLSRILRHVRRPPLPAFPNPLRRTSPLPKSQAFPPAFSSILNYDILPALNSGSIAATLSTPATQNVWRLCRAAGISIGAGSFALVALTMMLRHERRHPDIPLHHRKAFVGSFPLNPRPFLAGTPTTGKEDSLMLAFSDGISLPFIPSCVPVEGRFKLLGRLADQQLRVYQKRSRTAHQAAELGARGPGQMIPQLYLMTVERMDLRLPPEKRMGPDPQGPYRARQSETGATCGVSSVGDRTKLIRSGKYDIHDLENVKETGLVADFRSLRNAVRARDDEFLVGAAGTEESLGFAVSYDACAIDPVLAAEWAEMIENILEPGSVSGDAGEVAKARL